MSAGASIRLVRALRRLAGQGDTAKRATVVNAAGPGRWLIILAGEQHTVPAVNGAEAYPGETVAVLVDGRTGKPTALLGTILP